MAFKVPAFPTSGQKAIVGDVEVDPFTNEATIVGGTVIEVSKNGVSVGTQPEINFIEGTNITLTITEDTVNDRIDVEIDATGGGGGGSAHTIRDNGSDETQRDALNFISSTSVTAVATDDAANNETEVTFQRAALTGAIAASANSNATVFSGIRDNGATENDRTNLNFVPGTFITVAVTDDAVNDELEIGYSLDTNSLLAAIASTSIAINSSTLERAALSGAITAAQNSNVTAFGALAAKSVLANATNASAVPAALAGSVAFQYLRVNSANTALEWAVLSVSSPITLTGATIGFDSTATLDNNARVTVRKNTGANVGSRRRLNFIEGTGVTLTIADDSGSEEVDITIASSSGSAGHLIRDNGSDETQRNALNFLSSTSITAVATDDAANNETEVTFQRAALTGDVTASQNVNTTAFRTFAAKSVLANATNASAVPSDLAGSAAFQYLGVNSANTALEWRTLSVHGSTSIVYNSNTFERAALTGAIAASQNSNATLFAGIRDNGSAENDRTNLNFVSGNRNTASVTDDAGNDELEIKVDWTGIPLYQTGVFVLDASTLIDFRAGSGLTAAVADFTGGAARVTYSPDYAAIVAAIDSTSVVANGSTLERAALTGAITASQNSNATLFAGIQDNGIAETAQAGLNFVNTTSVGAAVAQDAGNSRVNVTFTRSALTGDVTASTNSNTTAFRSFTARSVLANATNASAVPTDLQGSAPNQYLRVNSTGTALEFGTIPASSPITNISGATIGFDQTQNLGNNARVAVNKNSGATVGTRRRLNFIEGTGVTLTIADDAGNEEVDITIASSTSTAGHTIRDNGSAETQRAALNFLSSTSIVAAATDDAGNNETEVTFERAALTGDVTASQNSNTTTIATSAVTDAKFRDSVGLSVVGRSANSTGNTGDIVAGTDGHVLRRSGTSLGFGTVTAAGLASDSVTIPKLGFVEQEETGAGPFTDFAKNQLANLLMFSNASAVTINSIDSTNHGRAIPLFILRQGAASLDITDAGAGTASNTFATYKNKTLRLLDDEMGIFVPADLSAGGTDSKRWVCASHRWPFHNSSDLAIGDVLVFNGTDWDAYNDSHLTAATTTVVTNSVTETTVLSFIIPADSLYVGATYEMVMHGATNRGATATAASLTVRLKTGGVTSANFAAQNVQTTSGINLVTVRCMWKCGAVGGSGTIQTHADMIQELGSRGAAAVTLMSKTSGTFGTTISQVIGVSVQFSAAVANLSFEVYSGYIRRVI